MPGYCTTQQVDKALGQALTSSRPTDLDGVRFPLWEIGNTRNTNEIPDTIVNEYIRWASDEIDSDLTVLYRTPLKMIANDEWYLAQDIDPYNPDTIVIEGVLNLVPGDTIYIISTDYNPPRKEVHIVKEIISSDEFTVEEPIFSNFTAGTNTRIVRVGYPPAITFVCARKAAANIYDKYFASQVSPDMSNYGSELRTMALNAMSDILNGVIILHGQERIVNRFAHATLYDRNQVLSRDGNTTRELNKP